MAFAPSGLVTLTTDFGTQDGYVGAMKGVIYREHPGARVVDLTHDIPPQDVHAGAYALAQAAPSFPDGTVHVAVVDPGVGSSRRGLIVEFWNQLYIGPDNGLLSRAVPLDKPEETVVWDLDRLPKRWSIQPTFHGRDVFARVAGRLAAGERIDKFSSGAVETKAVILERSGRDQVVENGRVDGEIIHADRFGNLISNVSGAVLGQILRGAESSKQLLHKIKNPDPTGRFVVEIAGKVVPIYVTYADVARDELVAYVGSGGDLEIAVRDGSAEKRLKATRGTKLRVRSGEHARTAKK